MALAHGTLFNLVVMDHPDGKSRVVTLLQHVDKPSFEGDFTPHESPRHVLFGECAKLAAGAARSQARLRKEQPRCGHCGEVMRCCS